MSMQPAASSGPDIDLPDAYEVLRILFDVWRTTTVELPADVPSMTAVEARLAGGVAALTGEPILDTSTLLTVARTIAQRLQGIPGYGAGAAIVDRLERMSKALDDEFLASAAIVGAWDAVMEVAQQLELSTPHRQRADVHPDANAAASADAFTLVTLLDYASRPALRAAAAAIESTIAATQWGRGNCPACGAPPMLSIARGKEGERALYCGRCGTTWPFPRLRCASCGERDHRRLGVLHAAGESEFRRVEVCDSCRGYLKTIAALDAPDADALVRLDLATAGLDFVALEQGYRRSLM